MTLQQLSIVIEVAREGSISKGAAKLYISQPGASAGIAAVEEELGYPIFLRSRSGVTLTERGRGFVLKARHILSQMEELKTPADAPAIPRLRVGVLSYTPTIEAFLKLYAENAGAGQADFSCFAISTEDGIRAVARMELDIAAVLLTERSVSVVEALARSFNLELHRVCPIPINVNLRRGHPFGEDYRAGRRDLSGLAAYPYVAYRSIPDLFALINVALPTDLKCSHVVTVDERDTRCRIVSETDAYSIGCRLPQSVMDRYGLESIGLSDTNVSLYYIIRRGEEQQREISRYLELLRQELEA